MDISSSSKFVRLFLRTVVVVAAPATCASAAVARAGTEGLVLHQEAEAMTNAGGCTGMEPDRVTYYCNGDATFNAATFGQSGRYAIAVRGASSNDSTAGIAVYVGGAKAGTVYFTGRSFSTQTLSLDADAGGKEIRLMLETDNGANDTIVDYYDLSYVGETLPPPVPPSVGAYTSGTYRNMFMEWSQDVTKAATKAKLDSYWNSLFASTDDQHRLYYPAGSNANGPLAYVIDSGATPVDVRSEGMSYGMMIAVQMNKKAEFNALWNWAYTNMRHASGPRTGYFAWQCSPDGTKQSPNPASDGEAYFATALFFAGHRWGNGKGIFNYTKQANAILNTMLHKEDMNGGVVDGVTNMFDKTRKMVVFVPYFSSAGFTDPSYHLPAFYELWGRWASGYNGQQAADRQFWRDAAATSRSFFAMTTNASTALAPEYAEFSGAPRSENPNFRFDAWRTAVNWSVDYAWWAADGGEKVLTDRLQTFFEGQGVNSYGNQFTLSGTPLSQDHSPGLVASNGAASLAATQSRAWKFVEAQWNLTPPTGTYRYYDGMLSFLGLLHTSGHFRIYKPSVEMSAGAD